MGKTVTQYIDSQASDNPFNSLRGGHHGGNLQAAAAIAGCLPDDILDFSASLNPLGPPKSVLKALAEERAAIIHYPDPHSTQLRHTLSHHLDIEAAWILPGNGAAELFTWAARECLQFGTTLIPQPAFSDYARALEAVGAPWEGVDCWDPEGNQPVDLVAQIHKRLSAPNPPSCLILNNPHNPTGQLWSVNQIQALLPRFQLVILDEAFMDFVVPNQSLLGCIQQHPKLVIIRSLTKFYAIAGLRIGFAVAHPDRLQRWKRWRDPWSVNGLATVAAIAALQARSFQDRTMNWLPGAKQQLLEAINAMPGYRAREGAANFLLVNSKWSVLALQAALLVDKQILIRDCLNFRSLGDRYFRVAVRTKADNCKLVRSIEQVTNNVLKDTNRDLEQCVE